MIIIFLSEGQNSWRCHSHVQGKLQHQPSPQPRRHQEGQQPSQPQHQPGPQPRRHQQAQTCQQGKPLPTNQSSLYQLFHINLPPYIGADKYGYIVWERKGQGLLPTEDPHRHRNQGPEQCDHRQSPQAQQHWQIRRGEI